MSMNHNLAPPNIGDVVACSDGDIGIVLTTYYNDDLYMIEVAWSSGETLTDPWRAQDYCTEDDMFYIMSRA